MSNELEDIFRLIGDNGYHDNRGARVDCANCRAIDKAKTKLNLLISKREIEARIDELRSVFVDFDERKLLTTGDTATQLITHEERIAQLTELQEGKE